MRILVLQLARFGDIYQTWPCLRALKRKYPKAEIHVLVRQRFAQALSGLDFVHVHEMPTGHILESIYANGDETKALERLQEFTEAFPRFDQIVNLSFSPFSSYLTDILANENTNVRGYSRHTDGFLSIPDDSSAYFYAQVGIGRANRYHLTDIFAAVANVETVDEDFYSEAAIEAAPKPRNRKNRVLVHLGASQEQKVYPAELWVTALQMLAKTFDGYITLIGSPDEAKLAATVASQVPSLKNMAGQTTLPELFELLEDSILLIGADSAPVHAATLTGTRVLNLSSDAVNFRETGPVTRGSRILHSAEMSGIDPARVAQEALAMIEAQSPQGPCFVRVSREEGYLPVDTVTDDFAWDLIQALYTGSAYPKTESSADKIAFQRLFELAELALQQIANWEGADQVVAARILGSVDEMLTEIPKICPNVEPVVQWFQTQRLRLPPSTHEQTLASTRKLFEELLWITAVYHESTNAAASAEKAMQLAKECAPDLREYDFHAIEPKFQKLISVLHDLARHSTNVGGSTWSSVLTIVEETLARQDFIALADLFEYELTAHLQAIAVENETFASDVVF